MHSTDTQRHTLTKIHKHTLTHTHSAHHTQALLKVKTESARRREDPEDGGEGIKNGSVRYYGLMSNKQGVEYAEASFVLVDVFLICILQYCFIETDLFSLIRM